VIDDKQTNRQIKKQTVGNTGTVGTVGTKKRGNLKIVKS
jgi:hypothetical protein